MSHKLLFRDSILQIPKPKGLVPRRADQMVVVTRKSEVRNEVAVASEGLLGNAVVALLFLLMELPDDDALIT